MPQPEHDGFIPDGGDGFKSDGFVPDTPTKPAEPGLVDKLGGWRGIAGTGVRALSGILSAEGNLLGSAISGLGEGAAELVEGSKLSPIKMGVEAGFGAIPFGKVVKAGELLPSIVRSGALGAAHTAASQVAIGQMPDITTTTEGGIMGGAMGALGSFLGGRKPSSTYEVEPTNRTVTPPRPITGTGEPIIAAPSGGPNQSPYPTVGAPAEANSRVQKVMAKDVAAAAKQAKLDAKTTSDAAAQAAIATAKEGRVQSAPSIRTSVSAPAESGVGRESMSTSWKTPKKPESAVPSQYSVMEGQVRKFLGMEPAAPPSLTPSAPGDLMDQFQASQQKGPVPAGTPWLGEHGEVIGHTTDTNGSTGMAPIEPEPQPSPMQEPPVAAQVPPTPEATSQESPLAKILKPSRSKKTITGFQGGVDKILGNYPEVETPTAVKPDDIISEEPPSIPPVTPQPSPEPPVTDTRYSELMNKFGGQAPVEPAPTPQGDSPLAKLFKSRVDAMGQANRDVKSAVAAGESVPEAGRRATGKGLQQEAKAAGLPTRGEPGYAKFEEPPVPTKPEDVTSGDWVNQESNWIDRLKKAGGSESGQVDPRLLKLMAPVAGAVVGAPTGAYLNPDDPGAPVKGALAGGILGYAASSGGIDELTNWRNAGLLASPSAQLKKPISDLAGYLGLAGEKAIQGDSETASNLMKELFRVPTNVSNYAKGFMDPSLTRDVIGDSANAAAKEGSGALGLVARPFAGAQYATQEAMQRAGIAKDAARDALFLGEPKTKVLQQWLGLQRNPVVRAIRPFARIGTNIFERGLERTPGVGAFMGDPATKVSRQLIGAGALGAGALVGSQDTSSEEAGNEPTNPLLRGLRRAALGSYALPFSIGEGLAGPRGMRDAFFMVPGLSQTLPPPAPKETFQSYGGKFAKRWLDQMLPDWANPYPDESVR